MEQLSRAATQGTITMRVPADPVDTEPVAPRSNPHPADSLATDSPNLAANTAIDTATAPPDNVDDPFSAVDCIDAAEFEIGQWDWPGGIAAGIAHWRKRLFGEFDSPEPKAALRLARLYLHYGFGAEARVILAETEIDPARRRTLLAMSHVVDLQTGRAAEALVGQEGCPGAPALWGVLALTDPGSARAVNAADLSAAFQRLPKHLKQHLGPPLSEQLVRLDRPDDAERILRVIDRGTSRKTMPQQLAEAELSRLRDGPEAAGETLARVVASGSEVSPRALVAMIETELEAGRTVQPETADLAAAYAVENKTTAIGADLRRVHLLARAGAGQFDRAITGLAEVERRDGMDAAHRLRAQILELAAGLAEDVPYLRLTLGLAPDLLPELPADTAETLARRLVKLGFPDAADRLLAPGGGNPRARAMIRARAALARGQPQRATAELANYTGQEADLLRARARAAAADYTAAQIVYDTLGLDDEATSAAWLAGDWSALAGSGDELLSSIAGLETAASADTPDDDAPLRTARDLIAQSRASRELLGRLLERMRVSGTEAGT